jgi:signal transduction histidine kinase
VAQGINEAIRQTRTIARGLCPVELSVSGLVGGLAEFAAETQHQSGIACRFQAEAGLAVPDLFVSLHLFRIVQEAVTNALRHAQARTITISLTKADSDILLKISDDGVGLPVRSGRARAGEDASAPSGAGLGLRTMKHRADAIGAQLTFKSRPGDGTVISCRLPADRTMNKEPKP